MSYQDLPDPRPLGVRLALGPLPRWAAIAVSTVPIGLAIGGFTGIPAGTRVPHRMGDPHNRGAGLRMALHLRHPVIGLPQDVARPQVPPAGAVNPLIATMPNRTGDRAGGSSDQPFVETIRSTEVGGWRIEVQTGQTSLTYLLRRQVAK